MEQDLIKRLDDNAKNGYQDRSWSSDYYKFLQDAKLKAIVRLEELNKLASEQKKVEQIQKKEEEKQSNANKDAIIRNDAFFSLIYPVKAPGFMTEAEWKQLLINTPTDVLKGRVKLKLITAESVGYQPGRKLFTQKAPNYIDFVQAPYIIQVVYTDENGVEKLVGKLNSPDSFYDKQQGKLINWATITETEFNSISNGGTNFDVVKESAINLQKLELYLVDNPEMSLTSLKDNGVDLDLAYSAMSINNQVETRTKLGDFKFAKIASNGGRSFVFDRKVDKIAVGRNILAIEDISIADPITLPVTERYVVLVQLPNGKMDWVTAQPRQYTSEERTALVKTIKSGLKSLESDSGVANFKRINNELATSIFISNKNGLVVNMVVTSHPAHGAQLALKIEYPNDKTIYVNLDSSANTIKTMLSGSQTPELIEQLGITNESFRKY